MTVTQFHRRLLAELRGMQVIPARATIVVATSGGPDSVALLAGLVALAKRRDTGWTIHAAHLDHGIRRAAAARDAAFVRSLAGQLGCACSTERCDVPAESRRSGWSLEEAARASRYAFLERVALTNGAGVVAVGHHADDQAETILHHALRGTGLRGLGGMPRVRPLRDAASIYLVRPLLTFRRMDLLNYLRDRGIACHQDHTNRDARHTRNRIRRRLLPLLEREFNPRVVDALLRLGNQARAAADLIDAAAADALASAQPAPPERGARRLPDPRDPAESSVRPMCVPIALMRGLPAIVQGQAVRLLLAAAHGSLREVGAERAAAVQRCINSGRGGWRVELPGGAVATRRGRYLIVEARPEPPRRAVPRRGRQIAPARSDR